jgi:phage-related baseplate assembly protein
MSSFDAINLADLPVPVIIDRSDFETILSEIKALVISRSPDLEPVLEFESEPMVAVLEAWAYRELVLRSAVDEAGQGNMLAFATGAQLDHLCVLFGVSRLVVQAGVPDAIPPVLEILESDARLRTRCQIALEGFTTAGSRGSYLFWALTSSGEVKHASVVSDNPGEVLVSVLSVNGDGSADAGMLAVVSAQLNAEEVRPLSDLVLVQSASILQYTVAASLTLFDGPDTALVVDAANTAVAEYVDQNHRLGRDITLSGIYAALHQPGVQNVELTSPMADIVVASSEAAFCTDIVVAFGGRDD